MGLVRRAARGIVAGVLVASLASVEPARLAAGDSAPRRLTPEELAVAFGQLPALRDPRLSPDGQRAVMIVQHPKFDLPIAVVHDFSAQTSRMVVASKKDEWDLTECMWANEERILCRFRGVDAVLGTSFATTRLVAVDADGSDLRVLMQSRLHSKAERDAKLGGVPMLAQFQDRIVDLLPDDRKRVLIEEPEGQGSGLSRLDIYSGKLSRVIRPRSDVQDWMTDGNGVPRVRLRWTPDERVWQHRAPGEARWETVTRDEPDRASQGYLPVGFGDDPALLLGFKSIDGRIALIANDVVGDAGTTVVFAHDEVDLGSVIQMGPHGRVVGAKWYVDGPHVTYFDPAFERVHEAVSKALPGKTIVIEDESWDRRFYIILAQSDVDPGSWYRLDVKNRNLDFIEDDRPVLRRVELARMEKIEHVAGDGTKIPGYVTKPVGQGNGPHPTIVLPHGGPFSRDVWGFDWLAQYLAARGFVVIQSNYRGSAGYGRDWAGSGAFEGWRLALADIDSGLQYLIENGVTDPDRVCAVGWSFGGFAALLSALEYPDRYRCVVEIAGVTDPGDVINEAKNFLSADWIEEQVSRSKDLLRQGSPRKRAKEFSVPVMIFHPEEDQNVDVRQGRRLHKALKKAGKHVEYIEYEDDEHGIESHESRIDMLTRIGRFLDEHLAAPPEPQTAAH